MPQVNANLLLSDAVCSDISDVAWRQWLKPVSPWHRAHSSLWSASLMASIHTVYEQAPLLYKGQSFNSVNHLLHGSAWTVHLLSFSFEHKALLRSPEHVIKDPLMDLLFFPDSQGVKIASSCSSCLPSCGKRHHKTLSCVSIIQDMSGVLYNIPIIVCLLIDWGNAPG